MINHLPRWGLRFIRQLRYRYRGDRDLRRILGVCLGLCLMVILGGSPGFAQTPDLSTPDSTNKPTLAPSATAPVVLDGQVIFDVRAAGEFSAEERADLISTLLDNALIQPTPADIVVEERNNQYVLRDRTHDQVLLTVTERDLITQNDALTQAQDWRRRVQTALQRARLERTPNYQRQALIFSVGVFCGAIALQITLQVAGRWGSRQIRQWLSRTPALQQSAKSAKLVWQLALLGLEAGLWSTVIYYITDLFPQTRTWRYRLFDFLTAKIITLGTSNYSALELLLLLGLTVALWFVVAGIIQLLRFYVLSRAGLNPRVQDAIAILSQYALTFLGLIILLQIWGLDVSSLTLLASVLGIGISFGIQNITNNFISGVIITLERPIEVGDFVNVADWVGTVEQIGARSTTIRTLDQVSIIVPNSRFLETEVINWSHGDPVCRIQIPVGVAYGSSVDKVRAALLEAARHHPDVLLRPRPEVWFSGFGDSAMNFKLMVWTGEPKKQAKVTSDLYYEIEASLRRYHLEVPFPQRDVHLRSPQLDQLVSTWQSSPLAQSAPAPSPGSRPDPPTLEPIAIDLETLVSAMQSEAGVEICDRHYRQNIYPHCFIAADAVAWLIQTQNCTRDQALHLGQLLVDKGIICHVHDLPLFEDGYVFYRFQTRSTPSDCSTEVHRSNSPTPDPPSLETQIVPPQGTRSESEHATGQWDE